MSDWNEYDRLRARFRFVCDVEWDAMTPTGDPAVRRCGRCDEPVHEALTAERFDALAAAGGCVYAPTSTPGPGGLVAVPGGPKPPAPRPPPPKPRPLAGAPRPPEHLIPKPTGRPDPFAPPDPPEPPAEAPEDPDL